MYKITAHLSNLRLTIKCTCFCFKKWKKYFMWKKKKIKLKNDTCQVSTLIDNCLFFPASVHVSVVSLQSCLIFCNAMNGSPPSSSGPGFFRENIGVSYRALLQGIFLTQEWKPILLCLLSWQAGSLPPCYLGSPLASVAAAAKVLNSSKAETLFFINVTLSKHRADALHLETEIHFTLLRLE